MITPARAVIGRIAARAAEGYLGGRDAAGAIATCARLAASGVEAFTLGFWNAPGADPATLADRYLETADALSASALDARIAVKSPAFGFQRNLVHWLRDRTPRRIGLHLDAHGIDAQTRTLEIGFATRAGVTIASRWRRSVEDARRVADEQLEVRVVKGQFPAAPDEETDPVHGYLSVIDALAGSASRVFVATHDAALARAALERLRAAGTPCELELLYGLPPAPALAVAADLGIRCRVYVPFGMAYLPYALAGASRNPRIAGWLLRDFVLGRRRWPAPKR